MRRRIEELSGDIQSQLLDRLHSCDQFSIRLDESTVSKHFSSYFSDVNTDAWDWSRNSFAPAATANGLTGKAEEQLLDLSCDRTLKVRFLQVNLANFWPSISHEYPKLTAEAMQILLPFPTTCLSESSFSSLTAMKTKYMAVEDDLRVCIHHTKNRETVLCETGSFFSLI